MAAKGSRSVYRQRRSTSRSVLSIGVSGIGRPYKTSRVLNLDLAALARTLMPEGTTQRHQAAS
jgi:hypothetical protein